MMLLGIWFHASCSYATLRIGAWPYRDPSTSAALNAPLLLIHVFRMPIFFAMAGFFARLSWRRAGTASFLRNRANRILLPFAVFWPVLFVVTQPGYGYAAHLTSHAPMRWLTWEYYGSSEFVHMLRTMHLWFLYYLVYLYAAFVGMAVLAERWGPAAWPDRLQDAFNRLVRNRWRPAIFAVPTFIPLFFMRTATLETDASFLITPKNLLAYAVFFGFGWLLAGKPDVLSSFPRHCWTQVSAALLISPLYFLSIKRSMEGLPARQPAFHLIAVASGAIVIWLFVFGIAGVFIRYLDRPSAKMRYLADASYWIYLAHLPLMVWIPLAIRPLPLPGVAKFAIVLAISVPLLLASYECCVRYTAIGRMLNGPRKRTQRESAYLRIEYETIAS